MSDPSEEDDSMEEDGSEEDSGSSEEGEDEVSGDESGSDYESVEEENPEEQNSSLIQNEQEVLSSSSDEGNERARCPVCLNRFIGQDLGVPENCDHIFCFECIKEWSTNINTCPIDRNEFSFIHMKRSPDGKIVKKVSVKVNSKGPEEGTVPEDNTHCEVCHLGDREHRLLLCDACDLAYHCDCLDPPLFHVPIEEWFCPPCSSVMTQAGDRALPSTSGFRRVIPRTSASESVRVRVQNRRTFPSTSSRTSSTPRPKKRKRRTYRRCIKKVVKLARTKAGGGAGKGGKGDRTSAVIVTYSKRYRRRRKRRKTKTKSRASSRSAESYVQSAKERIAKRLGLVKAHNKGSTVPDVRSKPGPSSQGSSKERPHSLFGVRDQLMDFSENFNESLAVPSTSTSTPRNLPERATTSSSSTNLLDSILAGQELLHAKSDNVIIRTDGSLIRKENEKKKSGKDASSSSKSVVRVGLYKTNPTSNPVKSENNTDTFSMLRGALNKKKSTESQPSSRQEPGPSSSSSPIFFSVNSRKTSKDNSASKKDSSRPAKKSFGSKSKYPESSSAPTSALKNSSKIDKTVGKDKSDKSLFTSNGNSKAGVSGNYSTSKPSTSSNFSDNQIKSEKVESSDVEGRTLNHRMDILQKRASFLEQFSSKPVASVKKENNEPSSSNELSSNLEIKSTFPKISEIKIKDEPLSSEEDEVCSQSIIGPTGFDSCLTRTFKTECQESESLIGNSIACNTVSETVNSSKTKLIGPNFIKEEIVSSDEESTKPSPKCDILVPEIKIKEEPKEKAKKKVNDLRLASNSQEKSFDNLPYTQAEDTFHDLPCTQAIQPLNNLPRPEASESFDQLPCTQAVEPFDDNGLPCTQAVEPFDDELPCTQAVEPFDKNDLPCTQAVDPFDDELPCTQAVEPFAKNDLPCTQAVDPFDDNELPCTQAVEHFDNNDLPCTQAVKHFDDFAVPNPVKSNNSKDTESQLTSHRDSEQISSSSPIFISVNSWKTSKNDMLTSEKDSTRLPKKSSDSKIQAVKCFDDLPCTQAVDCFEDLPCTQAVERFDDLPCTKAVDRFDNLPCTQAVERFDDLPCTQAVERFDDLPCTQAVEHFDDLPCTQAVERFDDLPCTQAVERFDDLPCTQAVERSDDLPCTQANESFDDLPCTQAVERSDDLPCTQAAERFDDFAVPNPVKSKNSKDTSTSLQGDLNKKKFPDTHPDSHQDTGPSSSSSPIFISVNSRKTTKNDKPTSKIDNTPLTKKSSDLKAQATDCFDDLPCTQAVERFDDLPCTQAVERFDDLPCTQAVERFDDLPCTQTVKRFDDLPCTQAVERFEDLPCTQAVERFDDLLCTQAVERFDDLPCTQAVKCFDDLPCTQAVESFDNLPCTQAVEGFDDLPSTQAVEHFDDLPSTQAVEHFDNLPCTQAVEGFDDLPCTQAVEHFDDLPSTQAVEHFDDLPSTQAVDQSNDLPTQVEDTVGNSSSGQGSGSLNDLPCTQLADGFSGDKISKSKLHGKSISNKSFKTSKDSDLLTTQHNLPEITSRVTESKMFTPVSDQEATEEPVLSEEEKILKLKQEALLEIKRKKPPPKVVGVHRNLPQVISNVPVRRPLIPKPINKSTFSFEQVKQRYNLEETLHSDTGNCKTDFKQPVKLENVIKADSCLSQSDSESTTKLSSLNFSSVAVNNHAQTLSCDKYKDLTSDKKTVSNLMGNITDSKSVKLSYNKETLQDVSNIKANKVKETIYQCSKEEPPSCFSTSQTTMQNNSFNTLIKKEPLDSDDVAPNQTSNKVNKVDLHIRESNMERALRLKREKNAEVLQQNAFKDIARITESPIALRMLSIKQEKNLEVMRENLLSVSETFSCSISTENNHNSTLNTESIHVKRENENSVNNSLKKEWNACKKSQSNFEVLSIKKEPVEEQEEAESNTSCNSSEHSKSSKADPCHKKGKHIKNKDSSERSNKSSSIDKTEDRNSQIKSENVGNKKSGNKNSDKDADQKESRKSNRDHHSTKDQSKKHVIKEQDTKKTDSDRKNRESVKDVKAKNTDIKHNRVQDKGNYKGSKNKSSENEKHDREKSSTGLNSNDEKRANKEMNCERKDKHSNSYEHHKKQSSDSKNLSVEKVKNGDYERKHKHSDDKKDGCKERTTDSKTKDSERDRYKLTNSKNKEGTKHSTNTIIDTGKERSHKESDSDRRKRHEKKDTDSKESDFDRNPKDKRDSRGRNSDLEINNSERNQSKESKSDRGHKNAEKDKHHKERSDKSHKYVEKDDHRKASNSDRNMKDCKNNSDKYLDGKVKKEENNKRHKESNSDKRSKHADIDVHYKDKNSDRSNKHGEKDKCSSSSRQSEKETHMNKSQKESTHNKQDNSKEKHSFREKSRTHISEKSNTSDQLIDASKIKREHTSNGEKKRPLEPESTDDSNPNKKRKMSVEISKQNLNDNSKCTSPDSTSGPDTTKNLIVIGSIKAETPLDERIKIMMSRGEFDIASNKKRRHESICSDSNSDISRISTEVHIKSEMSPFFSPKQIKLEDSKLASSSLKGSSIDRKSSMELKEKIAAEIKSILKPFYTVGVVNKEDYKDIMRRAVPKIFLNCGNCLNPEKIKKLVLGYVAKLKSS